MSDDPDQIDDLQLEVAGADSVPLALRVDAEAFVAAWAQVCASIRTVAVTIAFVGHTVWSVVRKDGEVSVVKHSAFEGRRILAQEAKRCLRW